MDLTLGLQGERHVTSRLCFFVARWRGIQASGPVRVKQAH